MAKMFIGIDPSRCSIGFGFLLENGMATTTSFNYDNDDLEKAKVLVKEIAARSKKYEVVRVCVEEPIANNWAPNRVDPKMMRIRWDFFKQLIVTIREAFANAIIITIGPDREDWAAFGSASNDFITFGRRKFGRYEYVKAIHPELKLPEIKHQLRPDGQIEVEDANYDVADAVTLAHVARRAST